MTQKIALRATTAAPTFFKPLLSFDELYVDGGIVASNPAAVAIHEARAVYPGVSECSGCCTFLGTFDLAYYSLLATNRYR